MKTSRNTGSIGRPKHNNRTPSRCRSGGGFLLPADLVAETEETDWSRVSRWPYFNPQGGRPRRNPETTCFCRQCTRRGRTCQGGGRSGLPCRARPAWGAQRNTPLSEIIPSHRSAERLPPRRGRDRESGQPRERTGSEKAADLSGRLTDGNQARRAESSDSRATTAFADVLERTSGRGASTPSLVSAAYRLPDNG